MSRLRYRPYDKSIDPPDPLWGHLGIKHSELIIGPPRKWAQLFASLHREKEYSDPGMRKELILGLRTIQRQEWDPLWKNGFVLIVFNAFAEGDFCGYTTEELFSSISHSDGSPQLSDKLLYAMWVLLTLFACLNRISVETGYSALPKHAKAVDIMQNKFAPAWTAVWEFFKAIRNGPIANEIYEGFGKPVSFYGCIMDCVPTAEEILRLRTGRLPVAEKSSHILPLLFLVWAFSDDYDLRMRSIHCIGVVASLTWARGRLEQFEGCPNTSRRYLRRLYEDLCNPYIETMDFSNLQMIVGLAWPRRPFSIETPLERKVFGALLGTYRRELCLKSPDETLQSFISRSHFIYVAWAIHAATFSPLARPTESQLYGLIGSLALWIIPTLERSVRPDDLWWPQIKPDVPTLGTTLSSCRRLLGTFHPPKPTLAFLRRHTYRAWRNTVAELDRRRDLREPDQAEWRGALIAWRQLGRFMPPDAREDVEEESGLAVLERCAWAGCGCHIHKPLHPVKVCKGCWLVAYCGPRCQTSDWESGGHRTVCKKFVGK
ncbi:zinc finger MYND domain-containing protein [Phanerochaete sordida]|uniref:Zinc finger MYND domain-containing protein n=1 Tax=Phanerochaete sordida TaxID=48140 RepID=A0A9P3G8I8_9APHY|nr:zinc finger MYND domain-containing protein [Phanerochaete sordida]